MKPYYRYVLKRDKILRVLFQPLQFLGEEMPRGPFSTPVFRSFSNMSLWDLVGVLWKTHTFDSGVKGSCIKMWRGHSCGTRERCFVLPAVNFNGIHIQDKIKQNWILLFRLKRVQSACGTGLWPNTRVLLSVMSKEPNVRVFCTFLNVFCVL